MLAKASGRARRNFDSAGHRGPNVVRLASGARKQVVNNTAAFALVGFAFAINAWPLNHAEKVIIKPVVHDYPIAQSLGCTEVARACRARMHSSRIGDKHGR